MAKITRIKAQDSKTGSAKIPKTDIKSSKNTKNPSKTSTKTSKSPKTSNFKKIFLIISWPIRFIFKPFAPLGRYLKASWLELRQVRWPSRKATWKMTLAALIYTGIFILLITLLDAFFTFIFNNLLK